MGQPGYSQLSRLGKYSHWSYLYNDNIKKKQVKFEYNLSLKFSLYFFFKYSAVLFKNHWFNYRRVFNDNINFIKIYKKNFYINISWKYKISQFTFLTKTFYTFTKFKSIALDSDIYIISLKNYLFIYWFWATIIIKKKKKK